MNVPSPWMPPLSLRYAGALVQPREEQVQEPQSQQDDDDPLTVRTTFEEAAEVESGGSPGDDGEARSPGPDRGSGECTGPFLPVHVNRYARHGPTSRARPDSGASDCAGRLFCESAKQRSRSAGDPGRCAERSADGGSR